MNIRKQADYSELYRTLDRLMELDLTDTELCYKIGRAICGRSEKGAAVVAAEYLRERYPDRTGCSPRNLRRMRDFFRAYENEPESAQLALQIGWTLNVIILEECNSAEERAWCLENTLRHGWKKAVLLNMIKEQAWLKNSLDEQTDSCYTEENNDAVSENENDEKDPLYLSWEYLPQPNGRVCDEGLCEESRTNLTISDCVGGYQPGRDRQSGLSAGTAQDGRAWDLLQRSRRAAAYQQRLRGIRSADWNGQSQSAGYVPDLRRRLCRQNAPPNGLHGPPRRCCRPVVHRRFRGNLAGCAGGLPRVAERIEDKELKRKSTGYPFVKQRAMLYGTSSRISPPI